MPELVHHSRGRSSRVHPVRDEAGTHGFRMELALGRLGDSEAPRWHWFAGAVRSDLPAARLAALAGWQDLPGYPGSVQAHEGILPQPPGSTAGYGMPRALVGSTHGCSVRARLGH